MPALESYKTTPTFTESTVPAGLLADHSTKEGTWGLIHVTQGKLRYCVTDPRRAHDERTLDPNSPAGVVEPTILHRVEPIGAVEFHVEFLRARDGDASASVQRKREERRAQAEAIGIDAAYVDHLVEAFYARIREDDLLGPIFAEHIHDWPSHLARMKAFWRSVLHTSGEFSGNPMLKHLAIPGLELAHFERWLDLFYKTLRDAESHPAATQLVGTRARMIADSLLTAIVMRRDGLTGVRTGKDLPHV